MRERRSRAALLRANAEIRVTFLTFVLLLLAAALAPHAARSAPAASNAARPATVAASSVLDPVDMKAGTLMIEDPGRARFRKAQRLGTDVDVTVSGVIARITITQRFQSSHDGRADGLFVIPLPDGASVDGLRMEIGERIVDGRIAPRSEVRRLIEQTLASGPRGRPVADALPNKFTSAVTNIEPGRTISVRLEYQQSLRAQGGTFSLRIPVDTRPGPRLESFVHAARLGPEFLDARWRGDQTAHGPGPVSLQLRLEAGATLGDIVSVNHKVSVKRTGESSALLALVDDPTAGKGDFELCWTLAPGAEPGVSLFTESDGESDHVMVMITPPAVVAGDPKPAREIVFVIDASGSMAGSVMAQTKASLLAALARLGAQDRFNIIRFNSVAQSLFATPMSANAAAIAQARAFIAQLDGRGGTRMLPALSRALQDKTPKDTSRIRQIVLLTDGAVADGPGLIREIAEKRGRSRLFSVGIGAAPDADLLRRAAEIGRGGYLHIDLETGVRAALSALLVKLERPAVSNLKASWSAGAASEIWPDPLPDIYAGEPLVVSARLAAANGALTIRGEIAGRPWKAALKLAEARPGPGVARLWAKRKIASIEARRFSGRSAASINDAIETVALRHRVPSRMTALVAIEQAGSNAAGKAAAAMATPVNRPVNWADDGEWVADPVQRVTLATQSTRLERRDTGHALGGPAARLTGSAAEAASSADVSQLAYYKTGNRDVLSQPLLKSSRPAWLALMALFFVVMCTVTLGFWRHLRREYASPRRIGRRI